MRHTILAFAVAISCFACSFPDEAPVTPAPTPVVTPAPAPTPVVVVELPAPFCPYETFYLFEVTERQAGLFQFSFRVVKDPQGRYLRRYEIQVYRSGREFTMLQVEAGTTLGGPHNSTVTYDWRFPGNDPGAISAKMRVHYPNECRDDGNGNVRANGPWGPIVSSTN